MIEAERALSLMQNAAYDLQDYWQKLYRLRRIVAGDKEALFGQGVGTNYDNAANARHSRAYRAFAPDILMQNFEEGRNNALFKFISVLVKQTAYAFPKVEIQGLTPRAKLLHNHYIKDRLTRCGWVHQNKIGLWDYLMCGTGEQYLYGNKNRPCVRWADTLDVKFDQVARLPSEIMWKSLTVCDTFGAWAEMFPNAGVLQSYRGKEDKDRPAWDMPFELDFFYSVYDDDGDYMVFIKTGDDSWAPEPVYKGKNPNYVIEGKNDRVPFLPFESNFYMAVPSVRLPVGVAEQALPGQIAVWNGIKRLQNIIDGGPAFYEIEEGVLDDEEEDAWQRGLQQGIVKVKQDMLGRIKEHQALSITPTDVEEIQRNLQEIAEQLGANAYSLGAPVKGVKYAKEVNAMQAMGSLAAGDIAKENADCAARMVKKLVAKGKLYDDQPLTFYADGAIREFYKGSQYGPVKEYLIPEADFLISEDAMRFVPQAQKLAVDGQIMDRAMQVARVMPNAVKKAFELFLTDAGIEDVDAWTEVPQAQPQQTGAPAQIDPNALPGQQVAIQAGAKGGALPS